MIQIPSSLCYLGLCLCQKATLKICLKHRCPRRGAKCCIGCNLLWVILSIILGSETTRHGFAKSGPPFSKDLCHSEHSKLATFLKSLLGLRSHGTFGSRIEILTNSKSIYESILQGLSIGASTVAGRLCHNAPAVSCTKAGNSGFAVKLLTNMGVRGVFTRLKQMKRLKRLQEQHWQLHRLSKHVDLSWASYTNGRFKVVLQRSACLHMCKP